MGAAGTRSAVLDDLGELIERRRLLDNDPQAYIDLFIDQFVRGDRPGWVEAEIEKLDEQINDTAACLLRRGLS